MMREGLLERISTAGARLGAQAALARTEQRTFDDLRRRAGRRLDALGQSGQLPQRHLRWVIEDIETRSPIELIAIGIGHDVTLLPPCRHHRQCRGTGQRHDRDSPNCSTRSRQAAPEDRRRPTRDPTLPDDPRSAGRARAGGVRSTTQRRRAAMTINKSAGSLCYGCIAAAARTARATGCAAMRMIDCFARLVGRRWMFGVLAAGLIAFAIPAATRSAHAQPARCDRDPGAAVAGSCADPTRRNFGTLEFRGGLDLNSLQGVRRFLRHPRRGRRGAFHTVSDKGWWLRGRITYDSIRPTGVGGRNGAGARPRRPRWRAQLARHRSIARTAARSISASSASTRSCGSTMARTASAPARNRSMCRPVRSLPNNRGWKRLYSCRATSRSVAR